MDHSFLVAADNNLIMEQRHLPNGEFWLVIAGDFARPYVVETSTNQWTPRVTNFVDSLGNLEFTGSAAKNRARGLYRVKGQSQGRAVGLGGECACEGRRWFGLLWYAAQSATT